MLRLDAPAPTIHDGGITRSKETKGIWLTFGCVELYLRLMWTCSFAVSNRNMSPDRSCELAERPAVYLHEGSSAASVPERKRELDTPEIIAIWLQRQ